MVQVSKTMIHVMVYNNIMQNIRNTVGSGIVITCTANDESQSVSSTIECDIGKLKDLRVGLNRLSWEDKYCVLKTDPDSDASSYRHTRPCESSSYHQFQPSWLKHHSWLHYSRFLDGAYCHVCVFCS